MFVVLTAIADPDLSHLKLGLGIAEALQYNFPESPIFDAAFSFDGVLSNSGLSAMIQNSINSLFHLKKKFKISQNQLTFN